MNIKKKIWAALTAMALAATTIAPIAAYADDEDLTAGEAAVEVLETEDAVELFDTVTAPEEASESMPTDDDEDGVITLTQDVALTSTYETTSGTTLTIDLAGYTIYATGCHAITVDFGSTLTIEDNSSEGTGKVDALSNNCIAIHNSGTVTLNGGTYTRSNEAGVSSSNNGGNSSYTILNHGTMTVNDGVTVLNNGAYSSLLENGYQNYSSGNSGSGYVEGSNSENPTLTINGGTFTGGLNTIKNDDGSILEINGGTFTNTAQHVILTVNVAEINGGTFISSANESVIRNRYKNANVLKGQLTINGGTFENTNTGSSATIITCENTTDDTSTVKVKITGGIFTNNSDEAATIDAKVSTTTSPTAITIYDGTITNNGSGSLLSTTDSDTITVIGGTFSADIVSSYIAENHYQSDAGEVVLSSTIVTDYGKCSLGDGSTATITLDGLEDKLKTTTWDEDLDGYHEKDGNVYDATEVATIDVVLEAKDAAALAETYNDISTVSTDDFAYDISVVKTYSDGTTATVPVTNQTVTVKLPMDVDTESSMAIYHIDSTGSVSTLTKDTNYTVSGNTITLTAQSFSVYYFGFTITDDVDDSKITDTITLNLTEKTSGVPRTYYITLDAKDDYLINRFMAAELAFELDDTLDITNIGAVSITPADYISITDSGNGEYEFNVYDADGVVSAITGDSILLGTMTITGEGYFSLSLKETPTVNTANQVQTAESANNIVNTYAVDGVVDGVTVGGELTVSSPLASGKITLATTTLTINLVFPNAVEEQTDEYTSMSVSVVGLNVDEDISFGTDSMTQDTITISNTDSSVADLTDYKGYSTSITVTKGYSYTLTFTGDGYRTYRTTIVPTSGEASVTVWNNAMDSSTTIVTTNNDNQKKAAVTFLAGDIVANNVIDLYDLSAVVSYFGKTGLTTEDYDDISSYIQYDLNRDGKIDSKDIAMVLVSWGF